MRAITMLAMLLLLPGCMFAKLSPEDASRVVEEAMEDGKTAWCVDLAIIKPMCLYKDKVPYEA
jgi:hypothetical protein